LFFSPWRSWFQACCVGLFALY